MIDQSTLAGYQTKNPELVKIGLNQCWTVLRMRDRYPPVINWVYTHLPIGSEKYEKSNNQPENRHFFPRSLMRTTTSLMLLK
jgi:hypothetical protein